MTDEATTDEALLRRPIVVLGAPRSGTTLLSQVLKAHPELHLANEPRILWKYGNDGKSDALRPRDARPEIVHHIRKEFAQRVRTDGKRRLVEKTPSNSLRVGFIDAVLPDAIYLHVMRAGAESVLSISKFWDRHSTGVPQKVLWTRLKELTPKQAPHYAKEFTRRALGKVVPGMVGPAVWGPRPPGIEAMRRDMDLLEVCAWQWRMCVEHACREGRKLPPERYTEVRLEELNEETLTRLMRFADLDPAEEVLAAFRERFDTSQPSRRSKEANEADLNYVRELIAPTEGWLAAGGLVSRH